MEYREEVKIALKNMSKEMREGLRALATFTSEQYVGGKKTVTKKMVQNVYDSIDNEEDYDMFDCGVSLINLMVKKRDTYFLIESRIKAAVNNIRLNLEILKKGVEQVELFNALAEANPQKAKEIAKKFYSKDNSIRIRRTDVISNKYSMMVMNIGVSVAGSLRNYKSAMTTAKTLAIFFEQYIEEFDIRDLALPEILEVIEEYKKEYSISPELIELYKEYCLFGDARKKADSPDYCFMPTFEQTEPEKKLTHKQYFKIV